MIISYCRAENAEAQMMKTGDFSAPQKEDWGAEGGVDVLLLLSWATKGSGGP